MTGEVVGRSLKCSGSMAGDSIRRKGGSLNLVVRAWLVWFGRRLLTTTSLTETIRTGLFARTMAFDSKTKNVYLLTAEFETVPNSAPQNPLQRKMKAGSFTVVVVGK
jgi:hypothetical protein